MFDISAGELIIVGVVALIVIGPKELPGMLRSVGQAVAKVRRMAGEFQSQFSEAMREAEFAEAKKKVEDIGNSVSSAFNDASTSPSTSSTSAGAPSDPEKPLLLPELSAPAEVTPESIAAQAAETSAVVPVGPAPEAPASTDMTAAPAEAPAAEATAPARRTAAQGSDA
jgi:sec-independent protein translocase protein TatB